MLVNRFDKFDFGTPKIGTVDSSNSVQAKRIENESIKHKREERCSEAKYSKRFTDSEGSLYKSLNKY